MYRSVSCVTPSVLFLLRGRGYGLRSWASAATMTPLVTLGLFLPSVAAVEPGSNVGEVDVGDEITMLYRCKYPSNCKAGGWSRFDDLKNILVHPGVSFDLVARGGDDDCISWAVEPVVSFALLDADGWRCEGSEERTTEPCCNGQGAVATVITHAPPSGSRDRRTVYLHAVAGARITSCIVNVAEMHQCRIDHTLNELFAYESETLRLEVYDQHQNSFSALARERMKIQWKLLNNALERLVPLPRADSDQTADILEVRALNHSEAGAIQVTVQATIGHVTCTQVMRIIPSKLRLRPPGLVALLPRMSVHYKLMTCTEADVCRLLPAGSRRQHCMWRRPSPCDRSTRRVAVSV